MSPRTGRPRLANAVNVKVSVAFDREALNWLDMYCKKNGLSRSQAVRIAVEALREKKK